MNIRKALRGAAAVLVTAGALVVGAATPAHAATAYVMDAQHAPQWCLRPTNLTAATYAIIEQNLCRFDHAANWWVFSPTSDGFYHIYNVQSGKCMNVNDASEANGALIIQFPCQPTNGTRNDQWKPINKKKVGVADYYQLVNRKSGRCLNVNKASTAAGADLIQYNCDTTMANEYFTWTALIIEQ